MRTMTVSSPSEIEFSRKKTGGRATSAESVVSGGVGKPSGTGCEARPVPFRMRSGASLDGAGRRTVRRDNFVEPVLARQIAEHARTRPVKRKFGSPSGERALAMELNGGNCFGSPGRCEGDSRRIGAARYDGRPYDEALGEGAERRWRKLKGGPWISGRRRKVVPEDANWPEQVRGANKGRTGQLWGARSLHEIRSRSAITKQCDSESYAWRFSRY